MMILNLKAICNAMIRCFFIVSLTISIVVILLILSPTITVPKVSEKNEGFLSLLLLDLYSTSLHFI